MIRLIKNEFVKLGFFKCIIPFLLFLTVIMIEYFFNKSLESKNLLELIPYIGIVLCVMFSGLVSNEMVSGTFKYYLTKSNTRFKVLTSKLLFVYIYTFILLLFLLILLFIINMNIDFHFIIKLYCYSIPVFTILSLCVLLSIITKNTPINLGICIFLLTFSGLIAEFLFKKDISIIEYTLLPYFDFNIFISRESISLVNLEYGINLNMTYAIIINMIHIILFNILSYFTFIKKDIKC